MHEIDRLNNAPFVVEVAGHAVAVYEVTMGNLPKFAAACAPFFDGFERLAADEAAGERAHKIFALIAGHAEAFVTAAVLVTDQDRAFFEALRPDEFAKVAEAVLTHNLNFFVQRLAPSLVKLAQNMGALGLMLSSAYFRPATAAPT